MKHVVKAISLTCDGCGQTFETLDGMTCYADDEDGKLVEETARNSDWKTMNGHHYCASCGERDDDDIIHTKDGRKWDEESVEVVEVREGEIIIKKAEGLASDSENEVAIR